MQASRASLVTLWAAVSMLTACGGGGGSDEPAAPAPSPTPSPAPAPAPSPSPSPAPSPAPAPAPSPVSSGLSAPTGTLSLTQNTADALVSKLRDGFVKAGGGYATMTLGTFAPVLDHGMAESGIPCAEGGTVSFAPTGSSSGTYTYAGCQFNGVTFNGTSQASYTLDASQELTSWTMDATGVTATVGGSTVTLNEAVECTVGDDGVGSGREQPQHASGPVTCVGRFSHNSYGADFHYAAGVAEGSFQCQCATNQWNMLLTDFTATAGTAAASAGTGTAAIRRMSATLFEVTITVNGQSSTFNVGS